MNRHQSFVSPVCIVLSMVIALASWGTVEAVGYPFADDFESGLDSWTAEAPWGLTTAYYASPVSSVTDSPSTYYSAWVDASLTLSSSVDLGSATRPVVRFRHRYQLEDGYDFGSVEISIDGGTTWEAPLAEYSGTQGSWVREQLDLSPFIGEADVRIRFRLVSDGTVNADGWYVDDVAIAEAPEAVTLDPPFAVETNSLELTWSESTAPDFSSYLIYRASGPGVDWRTAALVAEITDVSTTTLTDITVTPKSSYFYTVMVVTTASLHSLSNEESAITPAGMDYPFLDNGEGTGSAWSAQGTWALSDEAASSGSHAWSDSPGADYGNGLSAQSLTLVSPIDLTSASAPVLSFVHSYVFAAGDSGYVEISADGGSSWTALDFFTNGDSGGWLRERIDLSTWTFSDDVLVRFRITTDPSTTADGWHVDDISVAESPTVVPPPILDQVTSHSMRLTWSDNTDLLFSHYAIHRSASPGAGIQSTLVAEIFDQGLTSFTDTGLAVETDYYYRVYAVSPYGTYSPNSNSESTERTGGNPFPFADDFEGSLESWNLEGDWASTDTDKHGGERSLTDSPGTTSTPSMTAAAWTSIDLSGSNWPVLRFWDRFGMADDWAYLEVSPNGSTWYRLYTATGTRTTWAEQQVDLSPWKTATNLRIKFTVSTGGSDFGDGWYIDDLSIYEHSGSVSLPFSDDAEAGTDNWLPAAWAPSATDPRSGTSCFRSTPSGTLLASGQHIMELGGELDLSLAGDPQLVYWLRGATGEDGGFAAQVSTNGGVTWTTLSGSSIGENRTTATWTRYQFSLGSYLQAGVRIRFIVTESRYYSRATDIYLDDIAIEDMPEPVNLEALVPHLKSIDLSWGESLLGDFNRYEVYRSTSANVTTANDLVYSSSDSGDITFTDTGLSIGATYYYRVFVFNSRDVATPSNERTTTTVPLAFPFADPMENLDNWDTDGAWGPDGTSPYEGSFSLNDFPGDNSLVSSNTYILTAINLDGSSWPVLSFWDRHGMADDWAYLEVSPNGSSWYRLYTATGARTAWAEQQVDLSPWKTATNLRIRFTVATGGSNFDEGWYIDDLSIYEHSGSVSLPFSDDAEAGTDNWLPAAWAPSAIDPRSGTACFRSTPSGTLMASGQHIMELGGELDLSLAGDPQLVYWLRGATGEDGGFAAQVSTNGGVTWTTLSGSSIGENRTTATWTRYQFSLGSYLQAGVRIRFIVTESRYYSRATDIYLDDIAIEDIPGNVTLGNPDQITISSMRLSWNDLNASDFAAYAVYRSQTPTVDTNSELVTTITEQTTTEFTDTELQARTTYYYRVYFVDTAHVYSPSNSVSETTLGVTMPFTNDFETESGVWTFTGEWGRILDAGVGGSTSLGDSPGDFTSNVDSWAVTGVDLSGTKWPIVAFSERHDFAGHWGRFEISSDAGAHWTVLYGATGSQTEWTHRRFDLSPWRNQGQVWIRFFLDANSGVPADGWHIDDFYVGENPTADPSAMSFFEGFEDGAGNWLNGPWSLSNEDPYQGTRSILDTAGPRLGSSEIQLVYGKKIDLSTATDPLLTLQVRGNLPKYAYFRAEVSTDGGLTWQDLPELYLPYYWNSAEWVRMQTSLSGYLVEDLRLRFRIYGSGSGDENIFLDNISVGEQTPAAPTLQLPGWGDSEPTVRPTLVVNNAIDYQSDPLTYHYQVFDESELTNPVAEVPAVAGGIGSTAWTVDVDLLPDTQYWWRCRATDDGDNTGPWMETATFFVQLADHPPTVPVIVGPSVGGQLPDLNGRLAWLESSDPDEDNGDYVAGYRAQVDDDPSFASPEIDVPGITITSKAIGAMTVSLGELEGSGNLVLGTRYYWRINAVDSHGGTSEWSAGPTHFVFGTDETAPTCAITAPTDDSTVTDTPITVTGTASDDLSGVAMVEISTDGGTTWVQAVGAESWSHQWWPASSGDYTLTCRATDVAENEGTAPAGNTVHADLDRTMAFALSTASVDEDAGTYNVTVNLSAARATEVTAELVVSGSAASGTDFDEPPQLVRFFPGQTTVVFPVTITDDDLVEGSETITLTLGDTNIHDVAIGAIGSLTLTVVDNDIAVDPEIFADGFEEHGDLSAWSSHTP